MDFSEGQMSRDVHSRPLPQFSELRPAPSISVSTECADGGNMQSLATQNSIYAIDDPSNLRQGVMMEMYEKHIKMHQMINVPNYSQNNAIGGVQSNNLLVDIVSNTRSPSQAFIAKKELDVQLKEQRSEEFQQKQEQVDMTQYIHRLRVDKTLQQLIKTTLQSELIRRKRMEEEKIEHTQNSILNIPSVRNIHLQNDNSFINSDQLMAAINPNDLNVHIEQQENENNLQTVLKVEQQVQTDLPKIEKKSKFRAKIGEIKINVGYDGTTLYCCPECNLGLPDKAGIEQHIQTHLQERKYQCKECGAMLKRKEHLDQHMRGHSDERPFKCHVCQKAFKRNEHLTRHCVIHSGNKNFPCTVCQKAFSRKDHLNKHIQTHLGIRKNKMKEDSYYIDQKDATRVFDNGTDVAAMPKREISYIVKDGCLLKQETTLLQHIQNLQKNPNLLHTLSSLKEQVMKDANVPQQAQSGNMDENTRYLMPS